MDNIYEVNKNDITMNSDELKSIFDELITSINHELITSVSIKIKTLNKEVYSTSINPIQSYKNICKFLDKYAIYDDHTDTGGWMSSQEFESFICEFKDNINKELNIEICKDIDPSELDASDIGEIFDKYDLPYKVKYLGESSIKPYSINKK